MPDESALYPPALFRYQVTPTVVPHSEPGSPSTVSLMFFISNASGHDVEVEQIVFDLRYGNGPGDLTTSAQLTPGEVVGPDWSVTGIGDGRVRAAPRSLAPFHGLRAGESFGVVVTGVVVNYERGVANLIVWETSDEPRQSYVSVAKAPPGLAIVSFQAAPVQLDRQNPTSILSWKVTGEGLVTLSHDGATEQVKAEGFKPVTPRVTTLYTLTATGGGQRIHEQLTVYVPRVAVISFGADPPLIAAGQSSTLRWLLANASEAIILASGDEPDPKPVTMQEGTHTVTPRQATTTYTLAASGFGNVVTGIAQVDYTPTVERFSITPEQAPRDKELPLKLAWKVRYVTSVSVSGLEGPQPSEGSAEVRPKQTTSYTLSAKRLTPARTVRAHLTGQITQFRCDDLGKTFEWLGRGADEAWLMIRNERRKVPWEKGQSYVDGDNGRLNMVSAKADWANYIEAVFSAVPSSHSVVTASSDYGLNAVGAKITVEWPVEPGPGRLVAVRNGTAYYPWRTNMGPQSFEVRPASGSVVWELRAPGMMWTVYAGEPWSSAAGAKVAED
jgi:hypothetical protein